MNALRSFSIILILAALFIIGCEKDQNETITADARLKLANAYYTNGLYEASVGEYLTYLNDYQVDEGRTANTYYTMANIYFDRVNDYDKALQYYFKIKYLYPESPLQGEVGKKIVSCLERLQRSTDAARIMESEAALDESVAQESRPGAVLAKIGDREFTQGDLDFEISKLPVYMHDQFKQKNAKTEYLKQLVAQDLLYDSAKRKGLDKDKEVIEAAFRAQKALMAEKLLKEELKDQVKVEPADVELYYMAHKDQYVDKNDKGEVVKQKPFNEVAQQVAQDLAMSRQQQAYQKLIERLMKAESVQLFESRIK